MADQLTAEGLDRFDALARHYVGDDTVPGLVALLALGDQVHWYVGGSLSVGGTDMAPDSLFRITSMTKPITGATTMALIDEGLLALDEPVARLLPELARPRVLRRMDGPLDDTVPAKGPITVRQLLTFTFGFGLTEKMFLASSPWPIVAASDDLHLAALGPPQPDEQPDPDTWMVQLGSLPLLDQPGARWLYNAGALVLGVLLARAADAPFDEVLRSRIFQPLGMKYTGFWAPDTSRLATAYVPTDEGLVVNDPPDGQWSHPPAFGDGGAGLVSTAEDLLAFARMLLRQGGQVLSPAAVAEMTRNQLSAAQRGTAGNGLLDEGKSWGLCQAVVTDGPNVGAFGWDGGAGTSWLVDPVRDLTVIVLTQRSFSNWIDSQLHRSLEAAAYAAIGRS